MRDQHPGADALSPIGKFKHVRAQLLLRLAVRDAQLMPHAVGCVDRPDAHAAALRRRRQSAQHPRLARIEMLRAEQQVQLDRADAGTRRFRQVNLGHKGQRSPHPGADADPPVSAVEFAQRLRFLEQFGQPLLKLLDRVTEGVLHAVAFARQGWIRDRPVQVFRIAQPLERRFIPGRLADRDHEIERSSAHRANGR